MSCQTFPDHQLQLVFTKTYHLESIFKRPVTLQSSLLLRVSYTAQPDVAVYEARLSERM